ncbi:MAG: glycosyltransferase N-terminal domain-containing protein [Verrucomicrobiota bacterium]
MIWIYRLLFLPALLIALPYYGLRMWRRGGYGKDFGHRLGRFPQLEPPKKGKKRIWLQAVSVGEVLAVGPLIEALQAKGEIEVVLTTTTSTGYAEARKKYTDKVHSIGIFPLDFWLFSRLAWKRIQPDAIILTESELWPEHLHRARERNIPTFLVNARMSDKSYARYQKVRPLSTWLFSQLDHIYTASELDQSRLIELGGNDTRVTCSGSIKFDVTIQHRLDEKQRANLKEALGFAKSSFILLGSSTWPGEESALLAAQKAIMARAIDCRLLLVPRHAERGPEIAKLLKRQDLPWHQRSNGYEPENNRIHLADTTGELTQLSQVADLAFIGKSLPPNEGGQTPIEAAAVGLPILVGPNMSNFKYITRSLLQDKVALIVENEVDLAETALRLAEDKKIRNEMSKAAQIWHRRNQGSSLRIAESILTDLDYSE